MHVGNDVEELILIVLAQEGKEILKLACGAIENLAFAIDDVFLQIERDRLGGAEIFHGVGDGDAHLLAKTEEVVDSRACCEDDGGEIGDIDFLMTEFAGAQTLHLDERAENHLNAIAGSDVEVGRLFGRGSGL